MHFIIKLNPNYSFYWVLHGCLELCAAQHTQFTPLLYDHLYKVIVFVTKLRVVRHFAMSFISARSQTVLETTGFLNAFNKYHVIHPSAELQCPAQAGAVSWPVYLLPPPTSSIHCKQSYRGGKKKSINRREAEDDELREPPLIFHFDRLSSVKRQRRCSWYTELGSSLFVTQTYVSRMN